MKQIIISFCSFFNFFKHQEFLATFGTMLISDTNRFYLQHFGNTEHFRQFLIVFEYTANMIQIVLYGKSPPPAILKSLNT